MQTAVQKSVSDSQYVADSQLLNLRGFRPLFADELRTQVANGARCVRFEYCFSFLFVTIRRQSEVFLTKSWQQRYLWGLWYSVLALLLGPWGVPWGLFWTLWAVWVNTTGGAECTASVLTALETSSTESTDAQINSRTKEVPPSPPAYN
ncbi:hypothetical protein VT84_00395 [Gemmata sp. SH-PL17]|nr:hypothetical protein VT84_00395 [Gemmata sp. SH-PL17]